MESYTRLVSNKYVGIFYNVSVCRILYWNQQYTQCVLYGSKTLSHTHIHTHNFNIKDFKNDIKVKVQSLNK